MSVPPTAPSPFFACIVVVPCGVCASLNYPSQRAQEEGGRQGGGQQHQHSPSRGAKGAVSSAWFPGPPEETGLVSQPRLTPAEAESLFVAVVQAWSSLRCARRLIGFGWIYLPEASLTKPFFGHYNLALTTVVHSSRASPRLSLPHTHCQRTFTGLEGIGKALDGS